MSLHNVPRQTQGWIAIIILTISASLAPIFIRFAQNEGVPSLSIIIWRLVIGALMMTPFAWRQHRDVIKATPTADWGWTSAAGFFHALGLVCLFFALENTTVLVNGALRRTSPLWTIILEITLLGIVFNRRVWIGVVMALVGSSVIVISGVEGLDVGSRPLLGAGLSLLNAITLSIYIIIGRRMRNDLPFLVYTWALFSAAALMTTLFGIATNVPFFGFSLMGYVWIVVIALVAQVLGHLSANFSVRVFPATYVSILIQLSVVASGVIAIFFLQETPTIWHWIGSGIIIFGVSILGFGRTMNDG